MSSEKHKNFILALADLMEEHDVTFNIDAEIARYGTCEAILSYNLLGVELEHNQYENPISSTYSTNEVTPEDLRNSIK